MSKSFKLAPDQIRPIAEGHGACIASDQILVGGAKVGYMYRERPDNEMDSGWRFLAGTESEAYMDDPANFGVYDVNTVANYDSEIVPLLEAPSGTAFARDGDGELSEVEPPDDDDDDDTDFPVVEGTHQLTPNWSIRLPEPFKRRIEDGELVLWRPGLTAWISAWNNQNDESIDNRVAWVREEIPEGAFDVSEERDGDIARVCFRAPDDDADHDAQPGFYSFVIGASGHLQVAIYFDDEADAEVARSLWRGIAPT